MNETYVSVSQSWVDDMQRERQEMLRKLETQAEQLRQKDEVIAALTDVLEAHNNRAMPRRGFGGIEVPGTYEFILNKEEREKMRAALAKAGRKP
jgi:hypothetical protein